MKKKAIFSLAIIAWGIKYLDIFLNRILPNYFSENNLPLALKKFSIETWIYTFKEDQKHIEENENFKKLQLLSPTTIYVSTFSSGFKNSNKYDLKGHFQSLALRRALNENKTLLLFNPDTMIADGGINRCCELVSSGHKVVLVGELARASIEDALPVIFDKFYSESTKVLKISNRELMGVALKHLHPVAKHSFWKKGLFCTWPSFIYWKAGEKSLLAKYFHLHPIALDLSDINKKLPDTLMPDDGGLIEFLGIKNKDVYVVENSDEIACVELTSKNLNFADPIYSNTKNNTWFVFKWAMKAALKGHKRNFLKYNLYFNADEEVNWSLARKKAFRQTFTLRMLFLTMEVFLVIKQILKALGVGKLKRKLQRRSQKDVKI